MVDITFKFIPVEEKLPDNPQDKICITKSNGEYISWRRGYYENGRWHLPYTSESVIAWAEFTFMALDKISLDAWEKAHGRLEIL